MPSWGCFVGQRRRTKTICFILASDILLSSSISVYNVDINFDIKKAERTERVTLVDGQHLFCVSYFKQHELGLPESEAHLSAENRRLNPLSYLHVGSLTV